MESDPKTSPRGRPREFDLDEALDHALEVFWKNGYEGTSLPDLTAAMGINRPSLYAAFGNKEALFRKAIERYTERAGELMKECLAQPTSRAAAEHLLRGAVAGFASRKSPAGCFLVRSAMACSASAAAVQAEVKARRQRTQILLRQRFEQAAKENDLPPHLTADELAAYVVTVMYGLAVQAENGTDAAAMNRVVDMAMRVWDA
jgi:AcrR family transcriptional regulator